VGEKFDAPVLASFIHAVVDYSVLSQSHSEGNVEAANRKVNGFLQQNKVVE